MPPQAVRVAGTLNEVIHSERSFTLILEPGVQLRGSAEHIDSERLDTLIGKTVIVSGMARFTPSGTVLRIDAEDVDAASPREASLWAQAPRPLFRPLDVRALEAPQASHTGINALFCKWPGDESDEQLQADLEKLS